MSFPGEEVNDYKPFSNIKHVQPLIWHFEVNFEVSIAQEQFQFRDNLAREVKRPNHPTQLILGGE